MVGNDQKVHLYCALYYQGLYNLGMKLHLLFGWTMSLFLTIGKDWISYGSVLTIIFSLGYKYRHSTMG